MATTHPADSTQHARHSAQEAMVFDHVQRIGGLSRIVDRDIEILKMNLVQLQDGRYEARSSAWERLESAWETVRAELPDESTASQLNGDASPGNGAAIEVDTPMAAVVPTIPLAMMPLRWVTRVLGPAFSSRTRQVVRWSRDPARRAELQAATWRIRSVVTSAALAVARHVNYGWRGLERVVSSQATSLETTWSRLAGKWQARKASMPQLAEITSSASAIEVDSLVGDATFLPPSLDAPATDSLNTSPDPATVAETAAPTVVTHPGNGSTDLAQPGPGSANGTAWNGSAQARLESAKETVKSKLARVESRSRSIPATHTTPQLDEPTTSSPDMPFVVKPLPWFLGALAPVVSSRTMMMHHGSHYSQCIESANRLSRNYKNLAGKTPLEIVRWAREHARGTELLWTASEAWNHSFYWDCLTPTKKRPTGELRKALYRTFGDFANFADEFALAGATRVGSGWLWLTANSRKQVKILTTSGADCPEARGQTCLLAIDLWEHAYYLDHQNRRREYLDALIDRRLDWEFAEQRFRLVLQPETQARRKSSVRAVDNKRSRHTKPKRKAATSRR